MNLKSQRNLICCVTLGRLSAFSEPHFSHLHRRDNGLLDGFNYRHGWMCLNKCSSSLTRPFCLTLQFWLTSLYPTMLCCSGQKCLYKCMHPLPHPHEHMCTFSFFVFVCVSHTYTHTHAHAYTLVFLFWSTVAYLPCSLYNLVGFATRKIILNLRIVVPNKGTVTFLIVCVSWHPIFPWPSGYNIKVAMKAIDSVLYPLPSVQLKAKYTGSNWRKNLPCVLMG